MKQLLNSLEECIGNTPIVKLNHPLVPEGKSLFLKLEYFNPNFSIKDRTALGLVKQAIEKGLLKANGTLIESTSGNLGKSLAMLGALFKFKVILVMDPKAPSMVLNWCRSYGAQVIIAEKPDETGSYQKMRIKIVKEILSKNPNYYWPNQYDNLSNKSYHYHTTALEISPHNFNVIISSVSTGGHLSGIAKKLKDLNYPAEILASDVEGSCIFSKKFSPYLLNGLGLSWKSDNTDLSLIDKFCLVKDEEAISLCHSLAREAGYLIGGSGGIAVFAGLTWLYKNQGNSALCVIPDNGINYLDQFYDEKWLEEHQVKLLNIKALKEKILTKDIFNTQQHTILFK